jgi:hypothetical protein
LRGLPFILLPPIEAVAILLKFFGFVFFQHDHSNLVGGILQTLQYFPFIIYILSPSLFCPPVFSSFYLYHGFIIYGLFHDAASGADYIAEGVPGGWWWCMGNWIFAYNFVDVVISVALATGRTAEV